MLQLERAESQEYRAKTSPDCAKNQPSELTFFFPLLSDILKQNIF